MRHRCFGAIAAVIAIAGCGESSGREDAGSPLDGSSGACADRVGGALLQLQSAADVGESVWLWVEDDTFIDEAIEHQAKGTYRVANFLELSSGVDCDADHPWGVHPSNLEWTDFTNEECDATVAYVTENLAEWVARPTPNWCPWSGKVLSVDDRR